MQRGKEKIGLIVVDHGSGSQAANDTLVDVVAIKAFGGSNVRAFGGSVELDAESCRPGPTPFRLVAGLCVD